MAKGLKPKQTELEVAEDDVNEATDNSKLPIAHQTVEECGELFDGICTTKALVSKLYNLFNGAAKEIALRKLWLAKRWFGQACNELGIPIVSNAKAGATKVGVLGNAQEEAEICLGEINQLLSSRYFLGKGAEHFVKTKEYLFEARFALEMYIEDVKKTILG